MKSKTNQNEREIYVNILLLLNWEELYDDIRKLFETIENEFDPKYFLSKFELPESLSKIYENEALRKKIKDNAWKVAVEQGYNSAVELFVEMDSDNLITTDKELFKIYELNPAFI